MSKEMWCDEYERLREQAIDDGMDEAAAEKFAERFAWDSMRDRLADMADYYRQMEKDSRV